jgi:hypothetical protein
VMDEIKAKGFEQKFGIKLTAKFRHMPESFGRLLAKIGSRTEAQRFLYCRRNPRHPRANPGRV